MLFLLAAPAVVLPPDPPIELQSPTDGERLPVNADGITVRFTCPQYTESPASPPFPPTPGVTSDYGTGISGSAAVGSDGRLATRDSSRRACGSAARSTSAVGSGGVPRPGDPAPGLGRTRRACSGCSTGEARRCPARAGRADVCRSCAPRRAYAGYAFSATDARSTPPRSPPSPSVSAARGRVFRGRRTRTRSSSCRAVHTRLVRRARGAQTVSARRRRHRGAGDQVAPRSGTTVLPRRPAPVGAAEGGRRRPADHRLPR